MKYNTNDKYIMAISYNKNILENMILNIDPTNIKNAYLYIDKTPIYSLIKCNTSTYFVTNATHINTINLYAFNKITSSKSENALIDISSHDINQLKTQNCFKYKISDNNILFDFYYIEGIMNA